MFTPRFDAVRELEEWISTIQFNYVGSSPQKSGTNAVQVYELSNREDKQRQFSKDNSVPPTMSEQIVETLVKLFQTGMRPGLRGALEVIKILDRVPETIYVPVPNASFSASQLEKSSRWFRSEEEYDQFFDGGGNNNSNSNNNKKKQQHQQQQHFDATDELLFKQNNNFFMPLTNASQFDLVPLSMKFVRSALFVVNSAAAAALSPVKKTSTTVKTTTSTSSNKISDSNVNFLATDEKQQNHTEEEESSSSSPINPLAPKTAGAQLRMFLRICLQQRCLLAVVELLVGFLKNPGNILDASALSEFLFVHPSASPLIDDLAFPQVMECLRKFGGPPLVIRAAAAQCRLSIGPLLESPWNPEVAISSSEDGDSSPLTASWSMWFSSKGLRLKWNLEFNMPNDNSFPDYIVVEEGSSGLTSLQNNNNNNGGNFSSKRNNNNNNNVNIDDLDAGETGSVTGRTTEGGGARRVIRKIIKKKGSGGTTATTTTTKTVIVSPGGGGGSYLSESPRPPNSIVTSPAGNASNTPPTSTRTPKTSGRERSNTTVVVLHKETTATFSEKPQQEEENEKKIEKQEIKKPSRPPFRFTTKEETEEIIEEINSKKREELSFVNSTISRWKNEAKPAFQNQIAETVQPLLEAYATLVYAKWASALGNSALSENRLMECEDVDTGVDVEFTGNYPSPSQDQHVSYDDDDDTDSSADEFDLSKKPVAAAVADKDNSDVVEEEKGTKQQLPKVEVEAKQKGPLAW